MEVEEMLEGKFKETKGKAPNVQRFNIKTKGNTVKKRKLDNNWVPPP